MVRKGIVVMVLVLFSGVVYAQHSGYGMNRHYGNMGRDYGQKQANVMELLKLTDNQKLQLGIIKADEKRRLIRLKADISIVDINKKQVIKRRDFKEDVVRKIIDKTLEIRKKMELVKFDALLKTRKILTDEQWEKYCRIKNRKGGSEQQRMGRFRGRPHGRGGFPQQNMEY